MIKYLLLFLAVAYLARRAYLALNKPDCGCNGCGCDKKKDGN